MAAYNKISLSDAGYDSICVKYTNNKLYDFYGYGSADYAHVQISYQPSTALFFLDHYNNYYAYRTHRSFADLTPQLTVKSIGEYNRDGAKMGEWSHYNEQGQLYKTENFIIPRKEQPEITGL